ncbi:unnamed protein product, partial [Ectocarpus sp. 6 AP-2014]
ARTPHPSHHKKTALPLQPFTEDSHSRPALKCPFLENHFLQDQWIKRGTFNVRFPTGTTNACCFDEIWRLNCLRALHVATNVAGVCSVSAPPAVPRSQKDGGRKLQPPELM